MGITVDDLRRESIAINRTVEVFGGARKAAAPREVTAVESELNARCDELEALVIEQAEVIAELRALLESDTTTPLSEQIIPPIFGGHEDTWRDVGLADETCGRCWSRLQDVTSGWPGWREGYYDPDSAAHGSRDEQARGVADMLTRVCESVEVLWDRPDPAKPTDRHLLMWDLLAQAGARLTTMETQWIGFATTQEVGDEQG